jgi:4-hydroxy-4-methyl-2-oxoglutarate aldolase
MPLSHADLLKLKRWNTPTISNALESLTRSDRLTLTNLEEVRDFMPEMGPMVGRAMTVVISGGDPAALRDHPENFRLYREYLASIPEPKIVVVQDADKPACYGSIWGEVGANTARALGCVGTITDGAIRDLDEMKNAGFKALARRLAVGHAYCWPLRWGVEVEVFGTKVAPGQLIHADKHGFILVPEDAQDRLLQAARFMDDNECDQVILAARSATGKALPEILAGMDAAAARFGANARRQFGRDGEWKA